MMLIKAALTLLPRPRSDTLPADRPARTVTCDPEHLANYQRVCGFRRSDTLPQTYPHLLGFDLAMGLMTRSDFPFPLPGLVHIRNQITQDRALGIEPLDIAVEATGLRDHPRGRQFDIVTSVSSGGASVWHEISTYLRITKASSGAKEQAEPPQPHAIWRVGTEVGPAYAKVSGDHNPIHTSRIGARIFGFPRTIAHGMWSLARCVSALEGRLPDQCTVDAEFKLPILLPARVGFHATKVGFTLHDVRTGKPHLAAAITVGTPQDSSALPPG